MEKFIVIRKVGYNSYITCKNVTVEQIKTCHEIFKKQDKGEVTYTINTDTNEIKQSK